VVSVVVIKCLSTLQPRLLHDQARIDLLTLAIRPDFTEDVRCSLVRDVLEHLPPAQGQLLKVGGAGQVQTGV